MPLFIVNMAALVLAALSLGPSFAHVLEAPPRLNTWSPELWREATVFNGQFQLFAWIGGPLDVAALLASALLVYLLAADRPALWFALAGACLLAGALLAWVIWWRPPIPCLQPGVQARFRRISTLSDGAGKPAI